MARKFPQAKPRDLNFTKDHKCSRCGESFEAAGKPVPGMKCRDCASLITRINQLEAQLLAQEFSLEQEDEKIIKQISAILAKEKTGVSKDEEELLTALTERLFADEKRAKKIARKLRSLQRKKR